MKHRDLTADLGNTTKQEHHATRLGVREVGAKPEHSEDFLILARPLFGVDEKGRVATKSDAPDTLPGIDPAAWIVAELQSKRPHYWPLSLGAGAKGAGHWPHAGADASCFREGGTLTAQMALVARVGERAAIEACRRSGIVPPAWLTNGGGR